MHNTDDDPAINAFFTLHDGLPRQGPGSDATTRRLLSLAGPLPERPRVLDAGCGPGRAALLLAAEARAEVTAVDLHQPFLDALDEAAAAQGLDGHVHTVNCSMADVPRPDGGFDMIWAEGSAYIIGFDTALRAWRRLLAPGGVLVVTECEWATEAPAPQSRAFWDAAYPLRTTEQNTATAQDAGYEVRATWPQPDADWWDEYYTPLSERVATADQTAPGMAQAVEATQAEIALRRDHGRDYRYTGYVLRPRNTSAASTPHSTTERETTVTPISWTTRAETPADVTAVSAVNLAAFPTAEEAGLAEALRRDPLAWLPGLSVVAEAPDGTVAGHALLTRCHVGDVPALALAPCAVLPDFQRQGAGSAAIRTALAAARDQGENLVLVLGHPEYYPRFGFTPASAFGIRAPFEAPDEAMMALALDPARPVPEGTIRYPAPFGI